MNDESGIRIRDHRVSRFGAVRKSDHVIAELELAGRAAHGGAGDLERPARFGMPQRSYRCTIEATAAAVYAPTPARPRSAETSTGTTPR